MKVFKHLIKGLLIVAMVACPVFFIGKRYFDHLND